MHVSFPRSTSLTVPLRNQAVCDTWRFLDRVRFSCRVNFDNRFAFDRSCLSAFESLVHVPVEDRVAAVAPGTFDLPSLDSVVPVEPFSRYKSHALSSPLRFVRDTKLNQRDSC